MKSIRFGGKIRLWVLSGNHVLFSKLYEIRKKQHFTKHPADKYRGEQMRATACIVACSPPTACFFWAAQGRKLSLSASLEWAVEALKRHARDSNGDAAFEVLSFSSVFWVDRLILVALGRSSWWKNCASDRHCAMVCIRGRGCCAGRHPLSFTI